jgi:hypothetical protein
MFAEEVVEYLLQTLPNMNICTWDVVFIKVLLTETQII